MIRDEFQTNSNQFQIIVDKLNEDAGFRKSKIKKQILTEFLAKVYLWATADVDSSCFGNSTKTEMEELMIDKHGRELETDQIRKV